VKSNVGDTIDKKLDDFLVNLYEKKRMSQIPFRRLSQGEYEFGTQKVLLKVEGETIRGKKFSNLLINLFLNLFLFF
jgi:hypothetical protein